MSLLDKIRAAADKARSPEILEVRFQEVLTFTRGDDTWEHVQCSVQDPQKLKADAVAAAEAAARDFQVPYRDLRLLRVHPDEQRPPVGATAPWDSGGTLEILAWGQASRYTDQKLGTCVLRR